MLIEFIVTNKDGVISNVLIETKNIQFIEQSIANPLQTIIQLINCHKTVDGSYEAVRDFIDACIPDEVSYWFKYFFSIDTQFDFMI